MPEFIEKVKKAVLTFFLERQIARRTRKRMVMGFDEAKTVAVLFDASTAADYRLVMNYVKSLQDMGKRVICLGFIQLKKRPGYLTDHHNWSYCQKTDFGWNMRIKSETVLAFVNSEPDVLIDLSSSDLLYAKFLAGMSGARYKVGRFHAEQIDNYDLLIQVPETTSIQELMKHINHYLTIIKKPTPDAQTV
jgi:hypothetical protein